jgi:hypothetical protein
MLRLIALIIAVLIGVPVYAQTLTPPSLVTTIDSKLGSGTILTGDHGHLALQWGPSCALSVAQSQRLASGQVATTWGKTLALGAQLALSFWPVSGTPGTYRAHLAALGLVAYGSPNATSSTPLYGLAGLAIEYGGWGSVPTFGIGMGVPVFPGAGASVVRQPQMLVTVSVLDILQILGG